MRPGTCRLYARLCQACQGFVETGIPPIQHMVVGQHAAIDRGGSQAWSIARMHAVLNALLRPGGAVTGDCGFQIDDTHSGGSSIQDRQRIAPHVGKIDRPGNRATGLFGKLQIPHCTVQVGFKDLRIARVGQRLVDAPAGHDIARQEQRDGIA